MPMPSRFRSRAIVCMLGISGIVLSFVVSYEKAQALRIHAERESHMTCEQARALIKEQFDNALGAAEAMKAFYAASQQVSAQEFRRFANTMLKYHPHISRIAFHQTPASATPTYSHTRLHRDIPDTYNAMLTDAIIEAIATGRPRVAYTTNHAETLETLAIVLPIRTGDAGDITLEGAISVTLLGDAWDALPATTQIAHPVIRPNPRTPHNDTNFTFAGEHWDIIFAAKSKPAISHFSHDILIAGLLMTLLLTACVWRIETLNERLAAHSPPSQD